MSRPTIYALSTKPGRAAIGVIRVLGSHSQYVYNQLTNTKVQPIPRMTSVRRLFEPKTKNLLDEALTVFFKAPKTYTGEDLLELHVHGGNAIVKSVINAIKGLHNPNKDIEIRHADQGEFSHRAFINGRFDLTEVEGIREMIDAETETQRRAALSSLTGDTKQLFNSWRTSIVNNVALLTTMIDFAEEHDVEESHQLFDQVNENVQALKTEISDFLSRARLSDLLLKGIKISLLGAPNAGKLSFLNYLANTSAAIVSDIAGTTRDVLDVPLDFNGYKIVVGDTAGIRSLENADTIEIEGIRRAHQRALLGDLVIAVVPVNVPLDAKENKDLMNHIAKLQEANQRIIVVLNKIDLVPDLDDKAFIEETASILNLPPSDFHLVSCKSGEGMKELREALTHQLRVISASDMSEPVVISLRAQDLLENEVLEGLRQFETWKDELDVVLASESLRLSAEGIGKITGDAVGIEEVLGVVFLSFCIGK